MHANSSNNVHDPRSSALYKTELCRSYIEQGRCRYAFKCRFAHGVEDLRPVARHKKYKTEKCKNFQVTGQCPYGPRCRFIHDEQEAKLARLLNLAAHAQAQSGGNLPITPPEIQAALDANPSLTSVITTGHSTGLNLDGDGGAQDVISDHLVSALESKLAGVVAAASSGAGNNNSGGGGGGNTSAPGDGRNTGSSNDSKSGSTGGGSHSGGSGGKGGLDRPSSRASSQQQQQHYGYPPGGGGRAQHRPRPHHQRLSSYSSLRSNHSSNSSQYYMIGGGHPGDRYALDDLMSGTAGKYGPGGVAEFRPPLAGNHHHHHPLQHQHPLHHTPSHHHHHHQQLQHHRKPSRTISELPPLPHYGQSGSNSGGSVGDSAAMVAASVLQDDSLLPQSFAGLSMEEYPPSVAGGGPQQYQLRYPAFSSGSSSGGGGGGKIPPHGSSRAPSVDPSGLDFGGGPPPGLYSRNHSNNSSGSFDTSSSSSSSQRHLYSGGSSNNPHQHQFPKRPQHSRAPSHSGFSDFAGSGSGGHHSSQPHSSHPHSHQHRHRNPLKPSKPPRMNSESQAYSAQLVSGGGGGSGGGGATRDIASSQYPPHPGHRTTLSTSSLNSALEDYLGGGSLMDLGIPSGHHSHSHHAQHLGGMGERWSTPGAGFGGYHPQSHHPQQQQHPHFQYRSSHPGFVDRVSSSSSSVSASAAIASPHLPPGDGDTEAATVSGVSGESSNSGEGNSSSEASSPSASSAALVDRLIDSSPFPPTLSGGDGGVTSSASSVVSSPSVGVSSVVSGGAAAGGGGKMDDQNTSTEQSKNPNSDPFRQFPHRTTRPPVLGDAFRPPEYGGSHQSSEESRSRSPSEQQHLQSSPSWNVRQSPSTSSQDEMMDGRLRSQSVQDSYRQHMDFHHQHHPHHPHQDRNSPFLPQHSRHHPLQASLLHLESSAGSPGAVQTTGGESLSDWAAAPGSGSGNDGGVGGSSATSAWGPHYHPYHPHPDDPNYPGGHHHFGQDRALSPGTAAGGNPWDRFSERNRSVSSPVPQVTSMVLESPTDHRAGNAENERNNNTSSSDGNGKIDEEEEEEEEEGTEAEEQGNKNASREDGKSKDGKHESSDTPHSPSPASGMEETKTSFGKNSSETILSSSFRN